MTALSWARIQPRWLRHPSSSALRALFFPRERRAPRDLGLFGPGSIAWRLHAHPASFLGGGRALLVQALHPSVMAIFSQNTSYQAAPWGRLLRTSVYFAETTYGDSERANAAAARLRVLHSRLRGVDPVTGEQRRADDPDLLLWVHATAVHSFVTSYRRFAGKLTDADADRYTAEMVRGAELVGIPRAMVPSTFDGIRAYVRSVDGLVVSPDALEGMRIILFDPPVPRALVPAWRLASTAIISILPRRVRALYGLRWTRLADPPARLVGMATARMLDALLPRPWAFREALALARRGAHSTSSSIARSSTQPLRG